MAKFLGVDTGGTFTDFILYDETSGSICIHKVLSTPHAPEQAILQGMAALQLGGDSLTVVHGSTVATNAILEDKGVRTAYITNKGFADVLTIGRQARDELYNLTPVKQAPLIATELCLEVNSRLSAQAEHLQQLTEQNLFELCEQLQALHVEAVAINLLFSFFDDSEECRIEQAIRQHDGLKHVFISRSSDVLPEYKEFERGMTTVLNAKVGPLMQGYLNRLRQALVKNNGALSTLFIMQSSAGITSAEQAGRYPVNLLLSGPAGGLKGAQMVAGASDINKILSFDMGGTSTDVSIIDKEIAFSHGAKIAGYPVAATMVDMHTIGAGGGSIAQVDGGGLLLVGPESAGASPGPAGYGKGGKRATVTDANIVLGRLLPDAFLGGNMRLDKSAAIEAVHALVDELPPVVTGRSEKSMSVEQLARGIIDVVNDHMVRALRVMSVERGEDPKAFTLVSFGGAGGLHVCALADELEMTKAMVPVYAGVLSALGMLAADASRERSRTINKTVRNCQAEILQQIFVELLEQVKSELKASTQHQKKVEKRASDIELIQTVDVRYRGQSNAINLPWSGLDDIEQAFHQKHKQCYGHQLEIAVELVNVRVRAIEKRQSLTLPEWQPTALSDEVFTTMTGIKKPVAVIKRASLCVAQQVIGPALIIETSSTTWLASGWQLNVDRVGNLHLLKTNLPGSNN